MCAVKSAQKMNVTLLSLHASPCNMFAVIIDVFHCQSLSQISAMHFGALLLHCPNYFGALLLHCPDYFGVFGLQCPNYLLNIAQALTQPPVILIPQPWQALHPGAPFPPPHTPHPPHSGPTPRDQVLCDLVYLFNNVLRCYAPAVGHEITHQPSVMTDPTGQLVFAHAAGGLLGTVAEATPNKVREQWVH